MKRKNEKHWGAGMAQWWERSPCSVSRVRFPETGVICGSSLLLVFYSPPRGFSPGTPIFPSPQKPTIPNSNSSLECTGIRNEFLWIPLCSVDKQIIRLHFTYLFLQALPIKMKTNHLVSTWSNNMHFATTVVYWQIPNNYESHMWYGAEVVNAGSIRLAQQHKNNIKNLFFIPKRRQWSSIKTIKLGYLAYCPNFLHFVYQLSAVEK